ncbi:MAG: hypothetical protein LBU53_03765 [Zoogloeaceae bacterium]|jgi:hypothetical protein|nr:hypothetical protein [Zoogloeaceae bacterium]
MNSFQENLALGREWETKVSLWLQQNNYVLDVYEYTGTGADGSKAPKLKIVPSEDSLILPDLQVASAGATHWVEVKSKSSVGIPFKENPSYRTTGFDRKYWEHYLKVRQITGLAVSVFFVHYNEGEIRSASIEELDKHPRKYINFGNGMVYWPYDELKVIAEINNGAIHSI